MQAFPNGLIFPLNVNANSTPKNSNYEKKMQFNSKGPLFKYLVISQKNALNQNGSDTNYLGSIIKHRFSYSSMNPNFNRYKRKGKYEIYKENNNSIFPNNVLFGISESSN